MPIDPPFNLGPTPYPALDSKPEKPATDAFLEGLVTGGAIFVAIASLRSKEPAKKALELTFSIKPNASTLRGKLLGPAVLTNLLPAPFGYAPPSEFGLAPNYLRGPNLRAGIALPPSEYLATLPDTDPAVRAAVRAADARAQRQLIEAQFPTASVTQLTQLAELASGPNAAKLFFDPGDIFRSSRAALIARLGQVEGRRVATDAQITGFSLNLPAPTTEPIVLPSPTVGLAPKQKPSSLLGPLGSGEAVNVPSIAERFPLNPPHGVEQPSGGELAGGFIDQLFARLPPDP